MSDPLIFDYQAAMVRVENDTELLKELVDIFKSEYKINLSNIRDAINQFNNKTINQTAHSMKGALGNLGAMTSYHLAQKLEKIAEDKTLKDANSYLILFESEIEKFLIKFSAFISN